MYWFKSKFTLMLTGGTLLFFSACRPDVKESGNAMKYFDLKGYFTKDIARLTKLNRPVFKTVNHNGITESKTVHIDNWNREFDLFLNADINKPAWKNSYTIVNDNGLLIYKSKEPGLHVVQMDIKLEKDKVKWVLIYTKTKNILYTTTEKLSYFSDSLYSIEKDQKVRIMKRNHYLVQGEIK